MIGVRSGIDEYGQPSEFVVSGYVGEFKYFGFSDVPPHCLACDGSEVSRETYSELFAVFGTTFGAGDGVSTFNLPDLRGAFLRCTGGNAAELGTEQEDAIKQHRHEIYVGSSMSNYSGSATYAIANWGRQDPIVNNPIFASGNQVQSGLGINTENETRPINYAVNICVVYE